MIHIPFGSRGRIPAATLSSGFCIGAGEGGWAVTFYFHCRALVTEVRRAQETSQGADPLVPFPGRACVKSERSEPHAFRST